MKKVKKVKKIFIIISICLIGVGLLIMLAAFAMNRFRMPGSRSIIDETVEKKEFTVNDRIDNIVIDCGECYLRIIDMNDQECKVTYFDNEYYVHDYDYSDNTITIKSRDLRRWYEKSEHIDELVVISLPGGEYKDLNVTVESGDIIISGCSFENVSIDNKSGDIEFFAEVKNSLEISGMSGDIKLGGYPDKLKISPKTLSIVTVDGDITVDDIDGDTDLTIESTTGDIELVRSNCKRASVQHTSGDVRLDSFVVLDKLTVTDSIGDVEFKDSDAGSIEVSVTTGEVFGTLLSGKNFKAESKSGDVNVPPDSSGGDCVIGTVTGDINIKIAG